MIILIKFDIRMFLEWENNSGKLKIISGNFKTAGNFKITLLTTSSKFHSAMWLRFEFKFDVHRAKWGEHETRGVLEQLLSVK